MFRKVFTKLKLNKRTVLGLAIVLLLILQSIILINQLKNNQDTQKIKQALKNLNYIKFTIDDIQSTVDDNSYDFDDIQWTIDSIESTVDDIYDELRW